MADTFCSRCTSWQESFSKASKEEIPSNRFPNWAAVKASADQGCSLCHIVYQWGRYDQNIVASKSSSSIEVNVSKINGKSLLLVGCESTSVMLPLPVIADESDERRFNDYKERCKGILDPTASGSLDIIAQMASKWLRECRQNHCLCKPEQSAAQERILPTRLIDVGLNTQAAKLIHPQHDLLNLQYLILSYAWGPAASFAKTTASNLQAMNQSLPWDDLPKTVQDAILLTRKMGIRYLWVDALCILQSEGQDDLNHLKDWSYEAGRFGHYYQNALLTISATGAVSSHEGLFLPRSDMAFSLKSVALPHIDLTVRSLIPNWESEMGSPPLASRGWALQERFLSKKILHFGSNLILWECHELRASELDPEGMDHKNIEGRNEYNYSDFLSTFRKFENKGSSHDSAIQFLKDSWPSFINIYSRAEFSYYSDRLPALSGVASIIQGRVKQRYIAGLWEPDFTRSLLWIGGALHALDDARSKTDARQLNVPSWSWAASRRHVFFPSTPFWKPMCEIEDCDVKSKGSETSGQLISWRLRLRGRFKRLDLSGMGFQRRETAFFHLFEPFRGNLPIRLYLDDFTKSQVPYTPCPCLLVGVANGVGHDRDDKEDHEDDKMGYVLVLQSIGQTQDSVEQFRRIGRLVIAFRDWKTEVPEERTIEVV